MKPSTPRGALYAGLVLLLALHQDFWLWDDPSLLLGLPVGFTYHVLYCAACAVLLFLLVRFAWPSHLEVPDEREGR